MLLKYLGNPDLNRTEQLAVVMYYARMIDGHDLADLLGVSLTNVTTIISSANKKNKYFTGKRVGNHKGTKMYFLGPYGCKVVSDIIGKKVTYYEFSASRGRHYRGINMVLFRLIKEVGLSKAKKHIQWWNTAETENYLRDMFHETCKELGKDDAYYREKVKELIYPDAMLEIGGVVFFVEYDNDTEPPRQLREKMVNYSELVKKIYINPNQPKPLVLWVAPHQDRADELKSIWADIPCQDVRMGFYAQGEETPILKALMPSQAKKSAS
jgi:hypothetical protein